VRTEDPEGIVVGRFQSRNVGSATGSQREREIKLRSCTESGESEGGRRACA
jgi:hypothetical protein